MGWPGSPVAVCVFAKPPLPGRCKSRLAAATGPEAAAAIAGAMLADMWEAVCAVPGVTPILAATDPDADYGLGEVEVWAQGEGDLGERQERVARRALAHFDGVILVGADICDPDPAAIGAAVELLADHPAVLGAAADGGYWLIGLRACPPGLLDGIGWSTARTGAEVRARLVERLHDVADAAPGCDVDTVEDLRRVTRGRTLVFARRHR